MIVKISFSVCRRQQAKRSCWSIDPRFFACGALEKESTGRCCSLCFVINDTEGKSTTPATETAAWHFQLADEHRQKFSPAATNLCAMCLRPSAMTQPGSIYWHDLKSPQTLRHFAGLYAVVYIYLHLGIRYYVLCICMCVRYISPGISHNTQQPIKF